MKYYKFFLLSLIIILIDQAVKLYVHFNMDMGQIGEIKVFGDWFKIHYILNPGMAFGIKFSNEYGKLFLTLFRIFATFGIAYYIKYLIDKKAPQGLVWCVALILGGAVGNVIDSTFYGVWLEGNAPHDAITPWFHGQVVDMFYVDIWEGRLPEWLPLIGGNYYAFWPIFNVADASIFVGVAVILVMQRRFFASHTSEASTEETSTGSSNSEIQSATDKA